MEFVVTENDPSLVSIPDNPNGGQHWTLSNGRSEGMVVVIFRGNFIWILAPGETVMIWFEHLCHETLSPSGNIRVRWQTKTLLAMEPQDKKKQHVLWSGITPLVPCEVQ